MKNGIGGTRGACRAGMFLRSCWTQFYNLSITQFLFRAIRASATAEVAGQRGDPGDGIGEDKGPCGMPRALRLYRQRGTLTSGLYEPA